MNKPPKNLYVNFVVNTYKDMELAEEIEYSSSFYNYGEAVEFYNNEVEKVKKSAYVELVIEIEVDGTLFSANALADNYEL